MPKRFHNTNDRLVPVLLPRTVSRNSNFASKVIMLWQEVRIHSGCNKDSSSSDGIVPTADAAE